MSGSIVRLRVSLPDGETYFVQCCADDTLRILRSKLEDELIRRCGGKDIVGTVRLVDVSRHPEVVLDGVSGDTTLQSLGLWPGGSLAVRGTSTLPAEQSPRIAGDSGSRASGAPALPSEVLQRHLTRFDGNPLSSSSTVRPETKAPTQKEGEKQVDGNLCTRILKQQAGERERQRETRNGDCVQGTMRQRHSPWCGMWRVQNGRR